MSKIFIAANSMMIGGIEISLVSFLNTIDYNKHSVTLLLEDKVGELLCKIPSNVNIVEYKPFDNKNIIIRKIKNRLKFNKFINSNKNKFDVSICYASYLYLSSIIVRKICKNNYMWVHNDYLELYDKEEANIFFKHLQYKMFKNLVFVSENCKNKYVNNYIEDKQNYIVCPNLIPYLEMKKKYDEKITYNKNELTFINISRHDEHQKKISRIIEASKILKELGYTFKVILIGSGPNQSEYIQLVKKYQLNNTIIFEGSKINPFPYYKIADWFIISSNYEGGPITLYEALAFNVPVISTNVGDVKKYINSDNGIIIEKNIESLFMAMKNICDKQLKCKVSFDVNQYNMQIEKIINSIIKGDCNEI